MTNQVEVDGFLIPGRDDRWPRVGVSIPSCRPISISVVNPHTGNLTGHGMGDWKTTPDYPLLGHRAEGYTLTEVTAENLPFTRVSRSILLGVVECIEPGGRVKVKADRVFVCRTDWHGRRTYPLRIPLLVVIDAQGVEYKPGDEVLLP